LPTVAYYVDRTYATVLCQSVCLSSVTYDTIAEFDVDSKGEYTYVADILETS